jgi:hypothetical protein
VRAVILEVSPEFGPIDYLGRFAERHHLKTHTLGYRKWITYLPRLQPYHEHLVHDQVNVLLLRPDVETPVTT